jgi:hypothetical protein
MIYCGSGSYLEKFWYRFRFPDVTGFLAFTDTYAITGFHDGKTKAGAPVFGGRAAVSIPAVTGVAADIYGTSLLPAGPQMMASPLLLMSLMVLAYLLLLNPLLLLEPLLWLAPMLLVASLLLLLTCVPVVAGMLAEVPDVIKSQLLLKFMLSMLLASLLLLESLLLLAFLPLLAVLRTGSTCFRASWILIRIH